MPAKIDKDTIYETFKLNGEDVDRVINKIKELVHEGSVRNLIVKDAQGRTVIVVPLTVGVVGAALLPIWAALAAIAALAADYTIEIERRAEP